MGAVYLGFRADLKRRAAIKVLHDSLARNKDHAARFINEAMAACEVRHPGYDDTHENVVRVEHVGIDDEGRAFIVYEYLDGVDLETWLGSNGMAPTDFATEVILQICRVLDAAHPRIVHRDLKPANIFIVRRPGRYSFVKLLDFGIAKVRADLRVTGVQTDAGFAGIMGTPLYMAPEQATRPLEVDFKADIWAVGVILYELLSRRLPFPAEVANPNGGRTPVAVSLLDLNDAKRAGLYAPLSTWRPDLGPQFDGIIARCLAPDPSARYPNARALAQDITAASEDGPLLLEKVWPDYAASPEEIAVKNDGRILPGRRPSGVRSTHTSHSASAGSRSSTLPSTMRRFGILGSIALLVSALVVTLLLSLRAGDAHQTEQPPPDADERPRPSTGATAATPDTPQARTETDAGGAALAPAAASVPDAGIATPPEVPAVPPDSGTAERRRPHRASSGASKGKAKPASSTPPKAAAPPPVDARVPTKTKKVNPNDLLLGR